LLCAGRFLPHSRRGEQCDRASRRVQQRHWRGSGHVGARVDQPSLLQHSNVVSGWEWHAAAGYRSHHRCAELQLLPASGGTRLVWCGLNLLEGGLCTSYQYRDCIHRKLGWRRRRVAILQLPTLAGSPSALLARPQRCVHTSRMARQLFIHQYLLLLHHQTTPSPTVDRCILPRRYAAERAAHCTTSTSRATRSPRRLSRSRRFVADVWSSFEPTAADEVRMVSQVIRSGACPSLVSLQISYAQTFADGQALVRAVRSRISVDELVRAPLFSCATKAHALTVRSLLGIETATTQARAVRGAPARTAGRQQPARSGRACSRQAAGARAA
jgi:hypothetical protein